MSHDEDLYIDQHIFQHISHFNHTHTPYNTISHHFKRNDALTHHMTSMPCPFPPPTPQFAQAGRGCCFQHSHNPPQPHQPIMHEGGEGENGRRPSSGQTANLAADHISVRCLNTECRCRWRAWSKCECVYTIMFRPSTHTHTTQSVSGHSAHFD